MRNELAISADRPMTTPEGSMALRRLGCSMAWGEDDPIEASRWLNPTLVAMLPAAIVEAAALLAPATRGDFKRYVAPACALVAPAGWSEGDIVTWNATAMEALRGMPSDLLERGCRASHRNADHPSKVVKAIFDEVGSIWSARKRDAGRLAELERIARERPAAPSGAPIIQPEQATAIIEEFGLRSEPEKPAIVHAGRPRMPSAGELGEIAKLVGIDPTAARSTELAPDIAGMTVSEIFAQRDARRRAQQMA
jgi:hypothetical protein